MPSRDETRRIVERLHHGLSERLASAGWTAIEGEVHAAPEIGKFARRLAAGFSATAIFPFLRDQESGELTIAARAGIEYLPARDLLAALVASDVSGVLLNEPSVLTQISNRSGPEDATQRLVDFTLTQALPAAEMSSDIDSLITMLRGGRAVPFRRLGGGIYAYQAMGPGRTLSLHGAEAELVPALLAASGRREDARRALDEFIARDDEQVRVPEYRRFARQLGRRLDAETDTPLPTTPARWPLRRPTRVEHQSIGATFAKARHDARIKNEVVEATRALSDGKSRDEIKAVLQRELDKRDLTMEPLEIETQLDLITTLQEPFGRGRLALRGLKALKELGTGRIELTKVVRGEWEPPPQPDWIKPPERASYPVGPASAPRWAAVELDPGAQPLLGRTAELGRGRLGVGPRLEVWLAWDRPVSPTDPRLAAHIGSERVGVLSSDAATQFRFVTEAAAERDEDPRIEGRLTALSGEVPYLLEVALPAPSANAD
jgi:hypothetical protein